MSGEVASKKCAESAEDRAARVQAWWIWPAEECPAEECRCLSGARESEFEVNQRTRLELRWWRGNNYTKSYLLIADTNTHTHTAYTPRHTASSANTLSLFNVLFLSFFYVSERRTFANHPETLSFIYFRFHLLSLRRNYFRFRSELLPGSCR